MNNTTFIMGVVLTLLILLLSLGSSEANAAAMGDVTLQVLESNDPIDIVNDIDLPEVADIDKHESTHEIEDQIGDVQEAIEDDIDDVADDIDDSIDEAEVDNEDPPEEDD